MVAAEFGRLRLKARVAAGAIGDGGAEIVDDHDLRDAAEKTERLGEAAVEVRLGLAERELDVDKAAETQDGDEHRHLPEALADMNDAAASPVDL